MTRLPRFEDYRYVGVRDTMEVYDCDDPAQRDLLEERIRGDRLLATKQLQAFAPDTLEEARNRGFRPASVNLGTPNV